MPHDFRKFPELTNEEMQFYYWESPHVQIMEDFEAEVVKVHDGDTITVRTNFRDFDFPVRFLDTNAPELNEEGGHESQAWLENKLLREMVTVSIDRSNRVGTFGRLLGNIIHSGMNVNEESVRMGWATPFDQKNEGKIENINTLLEEQI